MPRARFPCGRSTTWPTRSDRSQIRNLSAWGALAIISSNGAVVPAVTLRDLRYENNVIGTPPDAFADPGVLYKAEATGDYSYRGDDPDAYDEIFDLEEFPRRILIAGGGYIAVEFAGVLRALGADVTVFVRFDSVLRSFDPMLQQGLMQALPLDAYGLVFQPVKRLGLAASAGSSPRSGGS